MQSHLEAEENLTETNSAQSMNKTYSSVHLYFSIGNNSYHAILKQLRSTSIDTVA